MLNKSSVQPYLNEHSLAYHAAKLGTTTIAKTLRQEMERVPKASDLSERTIQDIQRAHELHNLIELRDKFQPSLRTQVSSSHSLESEAYLAAIGDISTSLTIFEQYRKDLGVTGRVAATHYDYASELAAHTSRSSIESASGMLDHQWSSRVKVFAELYGTSDAAQLALKSHYLSVSTATLLAQEYVSRLSMHPLGAATPFPAKHFRNAEERFLGLTDVYGHLLKSYEKDAHYLAALPPVASEGPPKEILENAVLLDALGSESPEEELAESAAKQREQREWEEPTNAMLYALNPGFTTAFIGAVQALNSTNVDRARHVIVSLRELVTHVLHHLAPDPLVLVWIVDPKHLHNNKPTRAARIYYICRAINGGAFAKFVEADVRSALACIDLFQQGTHKIENAFNDAQLAALVTRTECMLRFLIMTARTAI
jgi:hypothetical protein